MSTPTWDEHRQLVYIARIAQIVLAARGEEDRTYWLGKLEQALALWEEMRRGA